MIVTFHSLHDGAAYKIVDGGLYSAKKSVGFNAQTSASNLVIDFVYLNGTSAVSWTLSSVV